MRSLMLPTICLLLAACVAPQPVPLPAPTPEPMPGPDLSTCGGNGLLSLVGHPVSDIPVTGGWGALRVIRPGMAVTEDYSDQRLNVPVDERGVILSLNCG